jgi:hypothetical protein
MGSVYRPRPFDRFHRAGRQRTHCVRPPRHSPGRDNTDRPVTTRPVCLQKAELAAGAGVWSRIMNGLSNAVTMEPAMLFIFRTRME